MTNEPLLASMWAIKRHSSVHLHWLGALWFPFRGTIVRTRKQQLVNNSVALVFFSLWGAVLQGLWVFLFVVVVVVCLYGTLFLVLWILETPRKWNFLTAA